MGANICLEVLPHSLSLKPHFPESPFLCGFRSEFVSDRNVHANLKVESGSRSHYLQELAVARFIGFTDLPMSSLFESHCRWNDSFLNSYRILLFSNWFQLHAEELEMWSSGCFLSFPHTPVNSDFYNRPFYSHINCAALPLAESRLDKEVLQVGLWVLLIWYWQNL